MSETMATRMGAGLGRPQGGRGNARLHQTARPDAGWASNAAPIAPPRSPSSATCIAGGWMSSNRWGSIASGVRRPQGSPSRGGGPARGVPPPVGLAEPDAEPAAEHDRLDVEDVLPRGDARPERLDRVVDQ